MYVPTEIIGEIVKYLPYEQYMDMRLILREHPETIIPTLFNNDVKRCVDVTILKHLWKIGAIDLFTRIAVYSPKARFICPKFAYQYASSNDCSKHTLKKLETIISKDITMSCLYAHLCKKGVFPEGEATIVENPGAAAMYARFTGRMFNLAEMRCHEDKKYAREYVNSYYYLSSIGLQSYIYSCYIKGGKLKKFKARCSYKLKYCKELFSDIKYDIKGIFVKND
jgi:hypothetical protein